MTHTNFKTLTDELDRHPRAPISWACGLAAAIVLIVCLAITDHNDGQQADQVQAEHVAWQTGVVAGRLQVQDELANTIASVHEQGRRAGRIELGCRGGK